MLAALRDHLEAMDAIGTWRFALDLGLECGSILVGGSSLRAGRVARSVAGRFPSIGDVRGAMRTLSRARGYSTTVVALLGLGVGASAAVFGLVDRALLSDPPVDDAGDVVLVWGALPDGSARLPVAAPDVAFLRERSRTLTAFAFLGRSRDGSIETRDGAGAVHVRTALVADGFFGSLGIDAALGRTHGVAQGDQGAPAVVVVSDGLWTRVLGRDPGAVGRTLLLNGQPVVVVGVLEEGFSLPLPPDAGVGSAVDVWVPVRTPLAALTRADGRLRDQDSDNTGVGFARLLSGSDLTSAQREIDDLGRILRAEVPEYGALGLGFSVRALRTELNAHARPIVTALFASVVLLLLVASLNLTTLTLARGMARRSELAVRTALGATPARLVAQLAAEGIVLAVIGAASGLLVASLGMTVLSRTLPASLLDTVDLALDARVAAFGILLAVVCGVASTVLPLVRTATRGSSIAKLGETRTRARAPFRRLLVIGQVAISVLLAGGAGLLARTAGALSDVHPGFEPEGALTFRLSLRVPGRYTGPAQRADVVKEIERSLASLGGVTSVGYAGALPLSGDRWTQPFGRTGEARSEWRDEADFRVIGSGYFDAMGTRLVEGRAFSPDEDIHERGRVVIVDDSVARRISDSGSAVGTTIQIPLDGAAVEARIVGVVEPIRHTRLDQEGPGTLYVPYRQEASRDVAFVVRSPTPLGIAPSVQAIVRTIDPQIPMHDFRTMAEYWRGAIAPSRFASTLFAGFAALALLGAAVGLYGVVSFEVGRRTRDIGVRMAVGASRRVLLRSMLRDGLQMGALGIAAGLGLAALAGRLFGALLYGVTFGDPATWCGVVALVSTLTLAACWFPARRASALDPTEALRAD